MINLDKFEERKGQVKIALEKYNIPDKKAKVMLFIDNSGSMHRDYDSGKVQNTVERVLPLAAMLDDDGQMPVYSFNNHCLLRGIVNTSNAYGFVQRHIHAGGGTEYVPVIKSILSQVDDTTPIFAIVITDGEPQDRFDTTKEIIRVSKENAFIQFIGIGNEDFAYLKELDSVNGRYVDNANFFEINDLESISDKELYDRLIKEFPSWMKAYSEKKDTKRGGILGLFRRK